MTNLNQLAHRHLDHALYALDEARYRISCAILAAPTQHAFAQQAAKIALIIDGQADALKHAANYHPATPTSPA